MRKLLLILFICLLLSACNLSKPSSKEVDNILGKNKIGQSSIVNDVALQGGEDEKAKQAANGDIAVSDQGVTIDSDMANSTSRPNPDLEIAGQNQITKTNTLQIKDLAIGNGTQATAGKKLLIHYVGTLVNGTKFDSSYDRNKPIEITLGVGQVIKGWDLGVEGMKVGGKRQLVIPPNLAYGNNSPSPNIPPNSTLVFQVELLDILN